MKKVYVLKTKERGKKEICVGVYDDLWDALFEYKLEVPSALMYYLVNYMNKKVTLDAYDVPDYINTDDIKKFINGDFVNVKSFESIDLYFGHQTPWKITNEDAALTGCVESSGENLMFEYERIHIAIDNLHDGNIVNYVMLEDQIKNKCKTSPGKTGLFLLRKTVKVKPAA